VELRASDIETGGHDLWRDGLHDEFLVVEDLVHREGESVAADQADNQEDRDDRGVFIGDMKHFRDRQGRYPAIAKGDERLPDQRRPALVIDGYANDLVHI